MKLRALLVGAAIAVIPASVANAQSFMDLPGMGAASGAMPENGADGPGAQASDANPPDDEGRTVGIAQADEPERPLELPGSGSLPVGGDTSGQADDDAQAAPETSATTTDAEDDELPRSGAPVAALALAGVALVSSGRLLREFAR